MKPTIPVKNRPGRGKLVFWLVVAAGVFVLINSMGDFKQYQDKAKAEQAGDGAEKKGGSHG